MQRKVEVAIIGAGTAGLNAMGQVRQATDSFVLINGGKLGTTCARVGCMPSKTLIHIANDFYRRHVLDKEGIRNGRSLAIDVRRALEHVRSLRDGFVNGIIEDVIKPLGNHFIEGYAEFVAPNLLKVGPLTIRAQKIIIATGSRPLIPDHWRHLNEHLLTTDTIFEQSRLPRDMAVIGLGAVGLELGQALSRLGISVTGFDEQKHVGGLQDPEVNRAAAEIIN